MVSSLHVFRWLLPILWGLVILVLSLMPGGQGNMMLFGIPHFDKVGHFGMYAIWTFLFFRAFSSNAGVRLQRSLYLSITLGTLIGIALEFGQYFMRNGRSFELADMLANALGAFVGSTAGYYIFKKKDTRI